MSGSRAGEDAVDMAMARNSESRCVSSIFVLPVLVVCGFRYVIGSCMRCYCCIAVVSGCIRVMDWIGLDWIGLDWIVLM